jgi:photosystem II stability/assembly factor-like uncharacterized protein
MTVSKHIQACDFFLKFNHNIVLLSASVFVWIGFCGRRYEDIRGETMKTCAAVTVFLAALLWTHGAVFAGNNLKDDLFSVSFPTAGQGWTCGHRGAVLHTADGGKSWSRQRSGTDYTLSSIFFVDASNGWTVGDGGTILRTYDGGQTWRVQESPVPYFLMDVWFTDALTGWIVTERTTILHTADGGETWDVQFSDGDFILKAVSFADHQNGWAVGEFGYIYHTSDGGQTWEHQAGMFDISDETGEMVGGNFIFDVGAVTPQEAWVVGIDGYVARTVDGGESWQPVAGAPRTHLFGVHALEDRILVAGDATLIETTDHGATWRDLPIAPTIRYGWLYRLGSRGKDGLVAVGMNGWIYLGYGGEEPWRRSELK